MQFLARLEALAPTDAAREDFRVANQRLWLAFQRLTSARPPRRRGRWAAVGALVLVAGAGVYVYLTPGGTGLLEHPGGSTPPVTQAPPVLAPAAPLSLADPPGPPPLIDELADSVGAALQNYEDRFELFRRKQLDCTDLAQAFVAANDRWVAYSVERRKLAIWLGAARAAADRGLYVAMDSVEDHQEKSGCPRP